ncbi:sulfotransferase domain-containing protein [Chloroflexota bacterium]|nr:sulfotransferase domain-containing protein [Chloroflexota bacterium]
MREQDIINSSKDQLRIWKHSLESANRWKRLSFKDVPPIFGNAFQKSGSHLLLQILYGVMKIAPYRHLEQAPVRMITAEGRQRSLPEIMHDLSKLKPGIIEWGYLSYQPEFVDFFEQNPQVVPLFIYRDPRDQLISSIFYAVDIHKQHAQHDYYASVSMDDCIKTAIRGREVPGLEFLPSIKVQYDRILGWLSNPGMLSFRFEDLVNDPCPQLERLLDFLEAKHVPIQMGRETAVETILDAIQPEKSPTFRKGKTGGWHNHFSDEHIQIFKDVTGDLLIELGYESNNDW